MRMTIVPIFSFPSLLATPLYLSPVTTMFPDFPGAPIPDRGMKKRETDKQIDERERERERGDKKNKNTRKAEK